MSLPPSPAELSKRYRAFWEQERHAFARNSRDPALVATALDELAAEQQRLPLMYCVDIRVALATAVLNRRRWSASALRKRLADAGRKGGRAPRRCPLNTRLLELVRLSPCIQYMEVIHRLRREVGEGLVIDVEDGFITYASENGVERRVSHAAIQHRLTRLKELARRPPHTPKK